MTYTLSENTDLQGHPHRLIRVLRLCWWGGGVERRGRQDFCGATGRAQATFKFIRGGPCCLPPVPIPVQAELSLCRTHRIFCWFCHAPAHLCLILIPKLMTHSLSNNNSTQSLVCINGYAACAWTTNGTHKKVPSKAKGSQAALWEIWAQGMSVQTQTSPGSCYFAGKTFYPYI